LSSIKGMSKSQLISLGAVLGLMTVAFIVISFAIVITTPSYVEAQAGGQKAPCPCPPNKVCPCKLSVQGSQWGICIGGQCKSTGYGSGAGNAGGATDAGLGMLKGLVEKALGALGGGGGGGGGMPPPPENPLEQKEDPNSAANLLKEISETNIKSPFDVLSGAFGTQIEEEEEEEEVGEITKTSVRFITDSVKSIGDALQNATGVSVGEGEIAPTGTGVIRENVSSNTNFEETDKGITLRTEVVDKDANTGVGSFFGSNVPAAGAEKQQASIVGRLCTAQPWQTSFVSRIFSSRFFNSICEKRGYTPGGQAGEQEKKVEQPLQESTFIDERLGRAQISCPNSIILGDKAEIEWTCGAALKSSGVNFETNGWPTGSTSVVPLGDTVFTLECTQGGTASCNVRTIGPEVQIVAHPQRVPLGARTRLYWVGENVVECVVRGPGLEENSLRGAATTEAILDQTKYTLSCKTEGGSVINTETVVDVGI
jgi:hypothetical protein